MAELVCKPGWSGSKVHDFSDCTVLWSREGTYSNLCIRGLLFCKYWNPRVNLSWRPFTPTAAWLAASATPSQPPLSSTPAKCPLSISSPPKAQAGDSKGATASLGPRLQKTPFQSHHVSLSQQRQVLLLYPWSSLPDKMQGTQFNLNFREREKKIML